MNALRKFLFEYDPQGTGMALTVTQSALENLVEEAIEESAGSCDCFPEYDCCEEHG